MRKTNLLRIKNIYISSKALTAPTKHFMPMGCHTFVFVVYDSLQVHLLHPLLQQKYSKHISPNINQALLKSAHIK